MARAEVKLSENPDLGFDLTKFAVEFSKAIRVHQHDIAVRINF